MIGKIRGSFVGYRVAGVDRGLNFFLKGGNKLFLVLKHEISANKENFADYIRYRQKLKINTYKLFKNSYADIYEYRHYKNNCVRSGLYFLFRDSAADDCKHSGEASDKIEKIYTVPRSVYLFEK